MGTPEPASGSSTRSTPFCLPARVVVLVVQVRRVRMIVGDRSMPMEVCVELARRNLPRCMSVVVVTVIVSVPMIVNHLGVVVIVPMRLAEEKGRTGRHHRN